MHAAMTGCPWTRTRDASRIASPDSVLAISDRARAASAATRADPDRRSVAARCKASHDMGTSPEVPTIASVEPSKPVSGETVLGLWRGLDPEGPPNVVWPRPADADRIALLLGAFDPV